MSKRFTEVIALVDSSDLISQRHILQHNLNLILSEVFIIVNVIAPECNQQLLLKRPKYDFQKEPDKLIVVNSFVTVSIHLLDQSFSEEWRQVEVLLGHFKLYVVPITAVDQTEEDA